MPTERLSISITGMTCTGCVSQIERTLRDQVGVIQADVTLASRQAAVTYDPDVTAPQRLAEAVQRLGFGASFLPARGNSDTGAPQSHLSGLLPQMKPGVWPVLAGMGASLALVGLYLGIVSFAQDWKHATELLWGDRWLVAAIAAGFGVQIGLYVHLRQLTQLHHRLGQCKALTATGTGGSSAAMVACCAHHLSDILPILGLSAAATFLNQYRVAFMVAGIVTNLVGIGLMLRLVRRQMASVPSQGATAAACHTQPAAGSQP